MPVFSWNEAETQELTVLFHEGLSFSRIAGALGSKTKNSCVSKAKRIGLPQRGKVIACERTSRELPILKQKTAKPPVHSRDYRCTIVELKDCSCRYPLWEMPEDAHLYCGKPTARLSEGRPYCATHAKLTFHTR